MRVRCLTHISPLDMFIFSKQHKSHNSSLGLSLSQFTDVVRIPIQLCCGSENLRKPQLEHDALLLTSSARPVCVANKVKGYGPAVHSAHAFCSFPVRTTETSSGILLYHLWKKHFSSLLSYNFFFFD